MRPNPLDAKLEYVQNRLRPLNYVKQFKVELNEVETIEDFNVTLKEYISQRLVPKTSLLLIVPPARPATKVVRQEHQADKRSKVAKRLGPAAELAPTETNEVENAEVVENAGTQHEDAVDNDEDMRWKALLIVRSYGDAIEVNARHRRFTSARMEQDDDNTHVHATVIRMNVRERVLANLRKPRVPRMAADEFLTIATDDRDSIYIMLQISRLVHQIDPGIASGPLGERDGDVYIYAYLFKEGLNEGIRMHYGEIESRASRKRRAAACVDKSVASKVRGAFCDFLFSSDYIGSTDGWGTEWGAAASVVFGLSRTSLSRGRSGSGRRNELRQPCESDPG
ncbi:hypothetical protein HDU87_000790 [Geranomyces variabilis]|uniref:Uncharacterized protein n=1 Tax=Geranomyces variabilis TaxID=109894 RepID=A0AAD5TQI2_9FUNG|nr:hypothetical protein HDU87_000790 [Geranomyces variabilis]